MPSRNDKCISVTLCNYLPTTFIWRLYHQVRPTYISHLKQWDIVKSDLGQPILFAAYETLKKYIWMNHPRLQLARNLIERWVTKPDSPKTLLNSWLWKWTHMVGTNRSWIKGEKKETNTRSSQQESKFYRCKAWGRQKLFCFSGLPIK